MQVILKQDVEKLGKKNEIREVADGYARNYLFPQDLAELATKKALKQLKVKKEAEKKEKAKQLDKLKKLFIDIDGKEVVFKVKSEGKKIFGSVTVSEIAAEVNKIIKTDSEIEEGMIKLEKPLKELGEFPVEIALSDEIKTKIIIKIKGE